MIRFRIIQLEERIVLDAEIGDKFQEADDLNPDQTDDRDDDHSGAPEEDPPDIKVLVISSNVDV
jgi:hypothetical protein